MLRKTDIGFQIHIFTHCGSSPILAHEGWRHQKTKPILDSCHLHQSSGAWSMYATCSFKLCKWSTQQAQSRYFLDGPRICNLVCQLDVVTTKASKIIGISPRWSWVDGSITSPSQRGRWSLCLITSKSASILAFNSAVVLSLSLSFLLSCCVLIHSVY